MPSTPVPLHVSQASGRPLRVLVASGPTHEPIDSVRYIGNRSSGRMGAAIADAFAGAGCAVTIARGPGALPPTQAVQQLAFGSAAELLTVLSQEWPRHDVLVMAAAVADFRPAKALAGKLKRASGHVQLDLEPTEDIVAALAAAARSDQFVVGFALEPEADLERSARDKLRRKGVDAIVANPLQTMDSVTVVGRVLLADGSWHMPAEGAAISKQEFATWLCKLVLPLAAKRIGARS